MPTKLRRYLNFENHSILIPSLTLGWHKKNVRVETWMRILSWNPGNYQAGARFVLETSTTTLQIESMYQSENLSLHWFDSRENSSAPQLPPVFWKRSFWQSSIVASFDLFRVIGFTKNTGFVGPLHLLLGVRRRQVFENRLYEKSYELFLEEAQARWSFFLGLRIRLGKRGFTYYEEENPNKCYF